LPTCRYSGQNRRDVLIRQIREAIAEENRKDIIERLWKGRQGQPFPSKVFWVYINQKRNPTVRR
jgi:hypothetical protein